MSLSKFKLTDEQIAKYGVVAAPDKLTGDPRANKMVFDRLIREMVKAAVNSMIDTLVSAEGAAEIGASVEGMSGGNVQSLLTALKVLTDSKAGAAATEAALLLKAETSVTDEHFKNVNFDEATGVFTFTRENGTTVSLNTALEKVAVNWKYDEAGQNLVLELADGGTQTVPLSAFISETEFVDGNTIEFSVSGGKVSAAVKNGSITDAMLSSALLEMLRSYVTQAAASATAASGSEQNSAASKNSAQNAAGEAANSAGAASASAQNASSSETQAKSSETNAAKSAAAALAAQAAAEKARDEASEIVGGNYATQEEAQGYATEKVSDHNTATDAHNDIRILIQGLTNRLNALANSDDITLDQMAEVAAYIKDNRELIEQITTGKVSVTDIVDNLVTNVSDKPLSAAQGVALKALIDKITVPTKPADLGLVTETWTFTLEDGSTVTKAVYVG